MACQDRQGCNNIFLYDYNRKYLFPTIVGVYLKVGMTTNKPLLSLSLSLSLYIYSLN